MGRLAVIGIVLATVTACGSDSGSDSGRVGGSQSALTEAQCSYFDVNGAVRICHATTSATHPYTILKVSDEACVSAHATHPADYVAVNDPTCGGGGCLPETAPCDAELPCCDALVCTDGVCKPIDKCAGVVCPSTDQCHAAGVCDSNTGTCSSISAKPDGALCDDGNPCTTGESCHTGFCGSPHVGSYTFQEIGFPGADHTQAWGINSFGDVVGQYKSAADGYALHAFILHAGTFTTIPTRPGATENWVTAIDDDLRVLGYTSTSDAQHPFIYENGMFTPITEIDNGSYVPFGWNAAGDIVGLNGSSGFLLHNGAVTTIAYPGASLTAALGINSDGDIVGSSDSEAFLLRDGVFSPISLPLQPTVATGISGNTVVGLIQGLIPQSFVYRDAVFTILIAPFAIGTYARGVNAAGQVVGWTSANYLYKGFVATPLPPTVCGGTCVDLSSDVNNCGSCGHVCAPNHQCIGGSCPCAAGLQLCGSSCVELGSDPLNCGTCGHACGPGQACSGGSCSTCPLGTAYCAPAGCINPLTNSNHCGACNNACLAPKTCQSGMCKIPCPFGTADCSGMGVCQDITGDAKNCGACGSACGLGQTCSAGSCSGCATGMIYCPGNGCIDPNTNPFNCGGCGNLCNGSPFQFCQAGVCKTTCPPLTVDCGSGVCANLSLDANNCGACGHVCLAGQVCTSGSCGLSCPPPSVYCPVAGCVTTFNDPNNCGSCGHVCPPGSTCGAGLCSMP